MKRTFFVSALAALILIGLNVGTVRADDITGPVVRAQGSAYHLDFVSSASKRGDLRLRIAARGIDAAFTEWLKVAHPAEYRRAAERAMAASSKDDGAIRSASSYCCAKDGRCCKGSCAQCCAKGQCTMGCCTMDACKKMRLLCCR